MTADHVKLLFGFLFIVLKIFKMAAHSHGRRMNTEVLAEIVTDGDSTTSDFSDSEFEPNFSEESEDEEVEDAGSVQGINEEI